MSLYNDPEAASLEYRSDSNLARLDQFINEGPARQLRETERTTSEVNESEESSSDPQLVNRMFGGQDWEDIADGFYTLFQHYEEISLEDGSEVFRELQDNYYPTRREAEEALFNYAVKDKGLEESIEAELEYI